VVVVDEVEEEVDVGVEVDMMNTAVDEGEDMVEEAEDMVEEAEGMAEVGMAGDGEAMTTVEGEDMVAAVTVSFCLYPHQGLLLFVLHP